MRVHNSSRLWTFVRCYVKNIIRLVLHETFYHLPLRKTALSIYRKPYLFLHTIKSPLLTVQNIGTSCNPQFFLKPMPSESWKSFLEKFQSAVQSPTWHSNSRQKIQIQFSLNGNFSYKSIGAKTKECKLKLFCHCFIFKLRILQWVVFLNPKMSQETLPSLFFWMKKFSQVFAQRLHIFQFTVLGMTAVALSPNYIHDFL